MARTLYHLAQLYEKQGKQDQALPLYQRAIAIQEQALVPEHPDSKATREALSRLVQTLQAQEQQGAARQPREVHPA